MLQAHDITPAARAYLGVPFKHQGRTRYGLDCLGLLVRIADDLQLRVGSTLIAAQDETDYGHIPDARRLHAGLARYCVCIGKDAMRAGDIGLFRIDENAQHLGVLTEYNNGGEVPTLGLIHAYAPARKVVEHRLDAGWQQRIEQVFRFPQSPQTE